MAWPSPLPVFRRNEALRRAFLFVLIVGSYSATGKLGLQWASYHPSSTAIWPPTGIALAALLVFGTWTWPAIFFAAFFVNVTTAGSVATSLGIATGNTLEAVVGSLLVRRFAQSPLTFDRPADVFVYIVCGACVATTISATLGVSVLSVAHYASWRDFFSIWQTWWLGDATGALVVAPVLILWSRGPRPIYSRARWLELGLLFMMAILVSHLAFDLFTVDPSPPSPLGFLTVPLLVWAAVRFGPRETTTLMLLLAGVAIWQTLHDHGPFARTNLHASLLLLQTFIAVLAVMALALAAAVRHQYNTAMQLRAREADLVASQAELRALFASMTDVVLVLDAEGRYLKIAPTNPTFLYRPPDDLLGKTIEEVLPGSHAHAILTHIREVLATQRPARVEYRLPIRGTEVWFDGIVSPLDDRSVLWVAHDITDRKRIEHELQQLTQHLEQRVAARTAELQEANRQLQELYAMKSAFVSTVSHELRTPMTSIKGFVENMLDGLAGPLSERQRFYLNRIQYNAERLTRLITSVLTLSKLERGQPLELEPVPMTDVITDVLTNFAGQAHEKSIVLTGPAGKQPRVVSCDRDRILQVLSNLVENALKFTPPHGTVEVDFEALPDGSVQVSVRDTGCGIPEAEHDRIFEPFYQNPCRPARNSGVGLGLSIVKRLIELHGGRVWVESHVNQGSRFSFILPPASEALRHTG
ncbi:MASE1 domain-containing protein [Candidatus Nitrospira bockiana]